MTGGAPGSSGQVGAEVACVVGECSEALVPPRSIVGLGLEASQLAILSALSWL